MLARFSSILGWRKANVEADNSMQEEIPQRPVSPFGSKSRKRSFDKVDHYLQNGTTGDAPLSTGSESPEEARAFKRLRISDDSSGRARSRSTSRTTPIPAQSECDDTAHASSTRLGRRVPVHANLGTPSAEDMKASVKEEMRLMAPPALPIAIYNTLSNIERPLSYRPRFAKSDKGETESVKSRHTTQAILHRPEDVEVFETERARRFSHAMTLPPDSGYWTRAEFELCFHLNMRGFEALLPNNWMKDFKTLPLALFQLTEWEVPLISPIHGSEFRAIKSLTTLFETGVRIRDELASKGTNKRRMKAEKILHNSIDKYLSWAYADAHVDTSNDDFLPLHHIVTRKLGKSTSELMSELELSLSLLAKRHRDARAIIPSIEPSDEIPPPPPAVGRHGSVPHIEHPQLHDDDNGEHLPTLTGILISYSVLALWTFNMNASPTADEKGNTNEYGEMRYIDKFDFSDEGMDVWNGLSVAIIVIMLRQQCLRRQGEIEGLCQV